MNSAIAFIFFSSLSNKTAEGSFGVPVVRPPLDENALFKQADDVLANLRELCLHYFTVLFHLCVGGGVWWDA